MEYRTNFVVAAMTSIGGLAGAIFSLSLFYQNGYQMGGWSWPQVLMVVGVYTLLDGANATILAPNHRLMTQHVREGTLDFVLLKPIDAQFFVSFRHLSLWGLPNVMLGGGLVVYAGSQLTPPVEPVAYAVGLLPILCSLIILYSMGFAMVTLSIWFIKLWNLTIAMQSLLQAGRYPIAAYPPGYRVVFTFVIPVAFLTTVPAQAMIGTAAPRWLGGAAALALGLVIASRLFWRFALRFYTSASS